MAIKERKEASFYHNPVLMDLFIATSSDSLNTDKFNQLTKSKFFEQGIISGFIFNKSYFDEGGNLKLNGPIIPNESEIEINPDWFIEYPIGFAQYFDVFYILPTDLLTGEIIYPFMFFEKSIPYHLAICPAKNIEEDYSLFTSLRYNYIVYSQKNIIKIYIPRAEPSYWGIYLLVKESHLSQFSTKYLPMIVVRQVDTTIYDNKDEYYGNIDPEGTNTYWFKEPEIVKIGLIKQFFNNETGEYEYELILDERNEVIHPNFFTFNLLIDRFYLDIKEKFSDIWEILEEEYRISII